MTNVLTKEELALFQSLQVEKGLWADTIAQLKKDQADTIKSLFLFAEQIETELRARGEQVNIKSDTLSAVEVVDTLLSSLLESVQHREEGLEGKLAQRDKDLEQLSKIVSELKRQLREAEECNVELEKQLDRKSVNIEQGVRGSKELNKYERRKSVSGVSGTESAGVTSLKTRASEVQARSRNEINKMAPVGNDIYDRVMDMVIKFVPSFSGERSPFLVSELSKFLDCVTELYERLPEEQKVVLFSCIKYRLTGDAYYLISTADCRTIRDLELTLSNAYVPKRSLDELRDELRMCRQRPGEELEEYAQRVSLLLKRTQDAISVKYPGGDEGLKKEFERDCIGAFKVGVLNDGTRGHLVGRSFTTLEQAKADAICYEDDCRRLLGYSRFSDRPFGQFPGSSFEATSRVPFGSMSYTTGGNYKPPLESAQYPPVSNNVSSHNNTSSSSAGQDPRQCPSSSSGPPLGRKGKIVDCFNCGKFGHRARECRMRQVEPFCVHCRKYGHTSGQCSRQKSPRSSQQGRRSVNFVGLQDDEGAQHISEQGLPQYCDFCATRDHDPSNCLRKYLAEQNQSKNE